MEELILKSAQDLIVAALREDLGSRGDITTMAVCDHDTPAHAKIIAKEDGIVAGIKVGEQVFKTVNHQIDFVAQVSDGKAIAHGTTIAEIRGASAGILTAERTALNFLGRLSGIATLTNQFAQRIKDTKAVLLDTRKTMPGWRLLEKHAVRCGGGQNHRLGLHDMFLVKDNHIAAAGSIGAAVLRCREYMQKLAFKTEIEVEARTFAEVQEAVELAVDRIMLDNMTCEEMRRCVQWVAGRVPLEASGNVTLETVRAIAETGVDFISAGALTHSAKSLDVSLLFC